MKIDRLFLSLPAVLQALNNRQVTLAELNSAIICTTQREVSDATQFDDPNQNDVLAALAKARDEQRIVFQQGDDFNNNTTFGQVNERLAQFDVAPLTGQSDTELHRIPLHACVPSVSDGSVEVLWGVRKLPKKQVRQPNSFQTA